MKLIAVTRVKNELDIIEPFVRHHAQHFDKIIVLDDGSTDGTLDVLAALQAASFPIVVLREPIIGYYQSRYMTRLLHVAAEQFGADWIAPLDADEFVEPTDGHTLSQALTDQPPGLLRVGWSNFAWFPALEESPERNPVVRQRVRMSPRADLNKLIIHANLVTKATELAQGNHELKNAGELVPSVPFDKVTLCHYPIRSLAQYGSKIAIGHLQYAAMADRVGQNGAHYAAPFKDLLEGDLSGLASRMENDSKAYSYFASDPPDLATFDRPLHYKGGPPEFTPSVPENSLVRNLLRYAERVAATVARAAATGHTEGRDVAELRTAIADKEQYIADLSRRIESARKDLEAAHERNFHQSLQLQSRTFRLLTRGYAAMSARGLRPDYLADLFFGLFRIKR